MRENLSHKAIKNSANKPGGKPNKLSDGGGLYLLVDKSGKYWRYDYRFDRKRKTLALGVFPYMGLPDARVLHEKAGQSLASGIDLKTAKDREKLEAIRHQTNTFQLVSEEWRSYDLPHWSQSRRAEQIRNKKAELA